MIKIDDNDDWNSIEINILIILIIQKFYILNWFVVFNLKIKNTNANAYSTKIYDDVIIVERYISKYDDNILKFKNSINEIIFNQKKLNEICDFYVLQIDNFISVFIQNMIK